MDQPLWIAGEILTLLLIGGLRNAGCLIRYTNEEII
jgi:hypothetical protein